MAGLFFFFVIIKLGDPVTIDTSALVPTSVSEWIFGPWPVAWGFWMLAPLVVVGLLLTKWKGIRFSLPVALPLAWLFWQFVSSTHTVDATLTAPTLGHFIGCVALFYLGYFGLHGNRNPWPLFIGMALAFCWIIHSGFEQHFGGLEATRNYIIKNVYGDDWPKILAQNPDLGKRIESARIFATFVYPNALAGGVLLLLPMTLVLLWEGIPKVRPGVRAGFVTVLAVCSLAILFWSGSKAGWLLAVVMVVIALFQLNLSRKIRLGLVAAILLLGLAGFAIRFTHYFARGATSVSARFDYWRAARQTLFTHPIFGTGPGTFMRPYAALKDPKSEMARLCHNDYLEQGSDSGFLGMALYCLFIFWSVYRLYRNNFLKNWVKEPILAAVSLGLIGLCLHSFVEYHLYIPALAWPLFFLLGWLWSVSSSFPTLPLKTA